MAWVSEATASPRLIALRELLRLEEHFPGELTNTRFWTPNVLVFDFTTLTGVRLVVEVVEAEGTYQLLATGRGAESVHAIKRLSRLSSLGARAAGKPRHLLLREWGSGAGLYDVRTDVLVSVALLLMGLCAPRLTPRPGSIPAYWWDMKTNFGDLVGPFLIQHLTGRPAVNVWPTPAAGAGIVSAGSILGGVDRQNMQIWGTGLMGEISPPSVKRLSRLKWQIHAVRGELTRHELMKKLEWDVPDVLGDPGLLIADALRPSGSIGSEGIVVVPHYIHKKFFKGRSDVKIVDVERPVEEVAAQIANAGVIISSSLHGLIFAQAYEVPWVWLRIGDKPLGGGDFKFNDFFSTLCGDRENIEYAEAESILTLDLARVSRKARLPRPLYSTTSLWDAFPNDFVNTMTASSS